MKYILSCYLAMIAPILYSCADSTANNDANKSTRQTAKHLAADNENHATFKEIRVLVAEYSKTPKDYSGTMATVTNDNESSGELKLRIVVD